MLSLLLHACLSLARLPWRFCCCPHPQRCLLLALLLAHGSNTVFLPRPRLSPTDDAFYLCPDRLRLPLIFYYAHTATLYVNKMLLSGMISVRGRKHTKKIPLALSVAALSCAADRTCARLPRFCFLFCAWLFSGGRFFWLLLLLGGGGVILLQPTGETHYSTTRRTRLHALSSASATCRV